MPLTLFIEEVDMHTPRELETVLKILNVLADIQKWELANIGFMGTVTGRQLYYGLVRSSSVDHGNLNVGLMKNIYHSEHIGVTERGVRLAVRALESEGGGRVEQHEGDKRARKIVLTEKLQQQMVAHAQAVKQAFEKNYLLIQK